MSGNAREQDTLDGSAVKKNVADFSGEQDLITGFLRNWKTLLVAAVLGTVCGLGLFYTVPHKWQASMQIQVGRIPKATGDGSGFIELPVQVVARVRNNDFVSAVVAAAGRDASADASDVRLFHSSLATGEVPNTGFVDIYFLGYSPDRLKVYAKAISERIKAVHNQLIDDVAVETRKAQARNERELAAVEQQYASLQESYGKLRALSAEQQLLQVPILTAQLQNSTQRLHDLREKDTSLTRSLSPVDLELTSVSEPLITDGPVSPRRWNFLAAGFLVGFACGFLFLLARRRIVLKLII